jgi:hypothetical protein
MYACFVIEEYYPLYLTVRKALQTLPNFRAESISKL